MTKRIGVLLCGCGHRDGSEVHEATLTLLAISKLGQQTVCIAPDGFQLKVCDHQTGEDKNEKRNMLVEAARISRGNMQRAARITSADFDALIIPGGQGAGLNLSTFLRDGLNCQVEPETKRLILETVKAKKPLGAICIAPATVAKALEGSGISAKLTIGNDSQVAAAIEKMGSKHEECLVTDCVVDGTNKIVSTPAYMLAKNIGEVWSGVEKLVKTVIELC
ncbi:MAG: isoprenoid biosynthesis glyoxalase ElbB [Pseudomonadota bacterium]